MRTGQGLWCVVATLLSFSAPTVSGIDTVSGSVNSKIFCKSEEECGPPGAAHTCDANRCICNTGFAHPLVEGDVLHTCVPVGQLSGERTYVVAVVFPNSTNCANLKADKTFVEHLQGNLSDIVGSNVDMHLICETLGRDRAGILFSFTVSWVNGERAFRNFNAIFLSKLEDTPSMPSSHLLDINTTVYYSTRHQGCSNLRGANSSYPLFPESNDCHTFSCLPGWQVETNESTGLLVCKGQKPWSDNCCGLKDDEIVYVVFGCLFSFACFFAVLFIGIGTAVSPEDAEEEAEVGDHEPLKEDA